MLQYRGSTQTHWYGIVVNLKTVGINLLQCVSAFLRTECMSHIVITNTFQKWWPWPLPYPSAVGWGVRVVLSQWSCPIDSHFCTRTSCVTTPVRPGCHSFLGLLSAESLAVTMLHQFQIHFTRKKIPLKIQLELSADETSAALQQQQKGAKSPTEKQSLCTPIKNNYKTSGEISIYFICSPPCLGAVIAHLCSAAH